MTPAGYYFRILIQEEQNLDEHGNKCNYLNVLFIKQVLKDIYRYLSNFTNMALELNTDHAKLLANTIPDWLSTYIRDFSKWLSIDQTVNV